MTDRTPGATTAWLRILLALCGVSCLLLAWNAATGDPAPGVLAAGTSGPAQASGGPAGTSGGPPPSRPSLSVVPAPPSTSQPPAPDPVIVPAAVAPAAQDQAREYWSPAAMESATPLDPQSVRPSPTTTTTSTTTTSTTDTSTITTTTTSATATDAGTAWSGGGLVARTTGRVFFSLDGNDYSCSASAVDSPDRSTVLTAAHCVETASAFSTRWVFVPGYAQGQAPYGVFVATHLAVLPGYRDADGRTTHDDLDVALINVGANAAGQTLVDAVGGQPMSFDPVTGTLRAFGYPGETPYDGSGIVSCAGAASRDLQTGDVGLACHMTRGASGGPWLADFDPATGKGRLVSVTSYTYEKPVPQVVYGPVFGQAIKGLYDEVAADPDK